MKHKVTVLAEVIAETLISVLALLIVAAWVHNNTGYLPYDWVGTIANSDARDALVTYAFVAMLAERLLKKWN